MGLSSLRSRISEKASGIRQKLGRAEEVEQKEENSVSEGRVEEAEQEEVQAIQILEQVEPGIFELLKMEETEVEEFIEYLQWEDQLLEEEIRLLKDSIEDLQVMHSALEDIDDELSLFGSKKFLYHCTQLIIANKLEDGRTVRQIDQDVLIKAANDIERADDNGNVRGLLKNLIDDARSIADQYSDTPKVQYPEDIRESADFVEENMDELKHVDGMWQSIAKDERIRAEQIPNFNLHDSEAFKRFSEAAESAYQDLIRFREDEKKIKESAEEYRIEALKEDLEASMEEMAEFRQLVDEEEHAEGVISDRSSSDHSGIHEELEGVEADFEDVKARFDRLESEIEKLDEGENKAEQLTEEEEELLEEFIEDSKDLTKEVRRISSLGSYYGAQNSEDVSKIKSYILNIRQVAQEATGIYDDQAIHKANYEADKLEEKMENFEQTGEIKASKGKSGRAGIGAD